MRTIGTKHLTSNQAGFSLVELMVVVAIIGILAAMSVGGVSKQIAKARQAEAKTNLAAVFSAEKVFASEYSQFTTQFGPLNLSFDGNLRYNTGFGVDVAPPVAPAYTGILTAGIINANAFCTPTSSCRIINTSAKVPNAVANTATAGLNAAGIFFLAEAHAFIFNNTDDVWTIDHNKAITNTGKGIP